MRIEREAAIEFLVAVAASIILYQLNVLYFLFVIPLNILALRRSKNIFLSAAGVVLVVVILQDMIRFSGNAVAGQNNLMLAIGLYGPIALLTGTVTYHLLDASIRRLYRFIISMGFPVMVGFVLIMVYEGNSSVAVSTREAVQEQLVVLFDAAKQLGYGDILAPFDPKTMYKMVIAVIERCVLPGFAIQLGFCILLANRVVEYRTKSKRIQFSKFKSPELMIWPFLISWAIVLLNNFIDLGMLGILGWNLGLGAALIYFIQGLTIVEFLLKKKQVKLTKVTVVIWLVVILFMPGINILVLIGMPLLGVSEIWIHYRDDRKENFHENNS